MLGMFGAHVGVSELFDWGQPQTWLDLVNGRSSILFALLAGISISLLSGRTQPLDGLPLMQARVRILIRAALIFAIGGLLQDLYVVAVILPVYAVLFVIAIPFLRWRSRRLFIAAGITAVVAPVVVAVIKTYVTLEVDDFATLMIFGVFPGVIFMAFLFAGMAIGRLDLTRLRVQLQLLAIGIALASVAYTAGVVGSAVVFPVEAASPQSGSSTSAAEPAPAGQAESGEEAATEGKAAKEKAAKEKAGEGASAPDSPDEVAASPDAAGKGAADKGAADKGAVAEDAADGGEGDGGDTAPVEVPTLDLSGFVLVDPHSGTPLEIIGSGGFGMGVIAICLLAARRRAIRWVLYPLACVGAMALTAYSLHIGVMFALSDYTLGHVDNWPLLWFVLGALIGCTLWTTFLGRGPFERLLSGVSKRTARVERLREPAPLPAARVG